jgi:hypothetical protein
MGKETTEPTKKRHRAPAQLMKHKEAELITRWDDEQRAPAATNQAIIGKLKSEEAQFQRLRWFSERVDFLSRSTCLSLLNPDSHHPRNFCNEIVSVYSPGYAPRTEGGATRSSSFGPLLGAVVLYLLCKKTGVFPPLI